MIHDDLSDYQPNLRDEYALSEDARRRRQSTIDRIADVVAWLVVAAVLVAVNKWVLP